MHGHLNIKYIHSLYHDHATTQEFLVFPKLASHNRFFLSKLLDDCKHNSFWLCQQTEPVYFFCQLGLTPLKFLVVLIEANTKQYIVV